MKRFSILACFIALSFSSCQDDNAGNKDHEKLLARKWQAVKIENPELTSVLQSQQHFVDTFGVNNTPAQNMAIYGFSNIDSLRKVLQAKVDSFVVSQDQSIQKTVFDFGKDKKAALKFEAFAITATWSLDSAGGLVLQYNAAKPDAETLKMDILKLTKDSLQLRYEIGGVTSTAIFKSIDK